MKTGLAILGGVAFLGILAVVVKNKQPVTVNELPPPANPLPPRQLPRLPEVVTALPMPTTFDPGIVT
jgi:hypothetical protein